MAAATTQFLGQSVPEHFAVQDIEAFFGGDSVRDREGESSGFGSTKVGRRISALKGRDRRILEVALSDVQVYSKLWLLDELGRMGGGRGATILVLGGWCGVLAWLAESTGRNTADTWVSFDLDPHACSLGRRIFGDSVSNLYFACQDIFALDYDQLAKDRNLIVVNTICEHIDDFPRWRAMLPTSVLTILQSNNFRGCPDHVNCVDSSTELADMAGFGQQLFHGALELSLFMRYMVIGRA